MQQKFFPSLATIILYTFFIQVFSFPVAFASDAGSGSIISFDSPTSSSSALRIVINELQWMGSDLSTADEWIELVAVSTGSIVREAQSLDGWTITQQKDTGEAVIAKLDGLAIGSGQYLVIANFTAAASRLAQEPDLVTSALSLPNTKLQLRLRDDTGQLHDEVDDGVGVPFAGANPSGGIKASMERANPFLPGNAKESWATATDRQGLDDVARVLGTPGTINSVHIDIINSTSVLTEDKKIEQNTISVKKKKVEGPCMPQVFDGVTITEFLPDPSGVESQEEWIELHSAHERYVSLCGWYLDDERGGSKPRHLENVAVPPGGHLSLSREMTGIALNNDTDIVRLIAPLPGGGSGVMVSIPYEKARSDQSFALRSDGIWLWTKERTPAGPNRFAEVDLSAETPPILLSGAMPNPAGKDEGQEWIEFTNMTKAPQWIQGWSIEDKSGKRMTLQTFVLGRGETKVLMLADTPLTLGNEKGEVRLWNSDDRLQGVLRWEKAKDNEVIRPYSAKKEEVATFLVRKDASMGVRWKIPHPPKGKIVRRVHQEFFDISPLHTAKMAGIEFFDEKIITNTISALMENKKIELQNDSKIQNNFPSSTLSGRGRGGDRKFFYLWANGVDIQSILLRLGYAYVTEAYPFMRKLEYEVYEAEAREQKRGLWATGESATAILAKKEEERLKTVIREEGIRLLVDQSPGLVMPGSTLTFSTNIPAKIYIAEEGRQYRELGSGSVVIAGDKTILAYAESIVDSDEIHSMRSNVVKHEYIIERPFYPACILISEVYPSPQKGEEEWVELYNKCDHEVPLVAWGIDDEPESGSRMQFLTIDHVARLGAYLVLTESGLNIALNNGGDEVHIMTPRETYQDSLFYPSIKKGLAVARIDDSLCITASPTPGGPNVCTTPVAKPRKSSKAKAPDIGLGKKFRSEIGSEDSEHTENMSGSAVLYKGLNINSRMQKINEEGEGVPTAIAIWFIVIVILMQIGGWMVYRREVRRGE